MSRKAVVLLNLGGPDTLEAVQPFLFNLFNDRAILSLPLPFRTLLAFILAKRRTKEAQEIYAQLGGGSPILANTHLQAKALENILGQDWRVFIAMRYWHPLINETIREIKAYSPTEIILVPLYPQFSTTTTASSFREWQHVTQKEGFHVPTRRLCCYPHQKGFIEANCKLIQQTLGDEKRPYRVLFSAHGLPERIIKKGDPYQSHVELTAKAIATQLGLKDFSVCYQSKVGPLKWLTPSIDEEIKRAGQELKGVVIVPLSFVSEHSETLVELDVQYQVFAYAQKVPFYLRVPTVGTHPLFIDGLAQMIKIVGSEVTSGVASFKCASQFTQCLCRGK
ncbi:MAG: ferrochelatase [Caedibacter sp. 37-49]|nr:MAG: ferrochelatase [Caedibacter sp. 37-49]